MKNDMKLIMESFRTNVLHENTTGGRATVGDFRVAMAVMNDPEAAKLVANDAEKYMELYKKVNKVKVERTNLKRGLIFVSLLAAAAPFLPALTGAAVATGFATSVSLSGLAIAGTQFIGELIEALQDKKLQSKDEIRPIMKALGIDQDLLAIIENDLEDKFFKEKIAPELKNYLETKPATELLPDFTLEFQQYLNTQTKLQNSTASQVSPKT
jgi:hypothetical protein